MSHNPEQVQMVWPRGQELPAYAGLPEGYRLRTYQPGDEVSFYRVMALAGWPDWDAEKLHPWLHRILPKGWFMVVEERSGEIVATSMATHDPTWQVPFCGEVGWTAADPAHSGKGLGTAVVHAVINRFLEAGYGCIHLYTEHWRYAALKIYLRLGFVPYLDPLETISHWETICRVLDWPFTPDGWEKLVE
jgi:mycothiol synthase